MAIVAIAFLVSAYITVAGDPKTGLQDKAMAIITAIVAGGVGFMTGKGSKQGSRAKDRERFLISLARHVALDNINIHCHMTDLVSNAIGSRKTGFVFLSTRGGAYTRREFSLKVHNLRIKLVLLESIFPCAYWHVGRPRRTAYWPQRWILSCDCSAN
jgi:hypothetical protein